MTIHTSTISMSALRAGAEKCMDVIKRNSKSDSRTLTVFMHPKSFILAWPGSKKKEKLTSSLRQHRSAKKPDDWPPYYYWFSYQINPEFL